MNPSSPVYIISKGRADSRLTSRALETLRVPYKIVVEEQEFAAYASVINKKKILVLDKQYQRDYDTCDEPNTTKGPGSGPARNFVWDHATARGHEWHWIVDDNIKAFFRWNKNLKVPVSDGTIFRCMEDFVGRYSNVTMAGPNYFMFASRKTKAPPFKLNTRIYSCNLIKNSARFRWRGRYNEDTDLSLRMLKAGFCTILFNAFLQEKTTTLTMRGGNTDDIYKGGTLPKSQMLVRLHPDVAKFSWRWGREHHFVDYSRFKHGLIRRPGLEISSDVDNYGMQLVAVECTVRWFQYVHHKDRAFFERKGWTFAADLGPTHGHWSVLMQAPEGFDGRQQAGRRASKYPRTSTRHGRARNQAEGGRGHHGEDRPE